MIRFACPMCQKQLSAPDDQAGLKLPCPGCGQRLSIPAPPANKTMLGTLLPGRTGSTADPPPGLPVQLPAVALPTARPFEEYETLEVVGPLRTGPVVHIHQGGAGRAPVEPSSLATVLGICSLACAVAAALFLVLPCLWFLCLPLSGIGTVLGLGGVCTAVSRQGRGLACSAVGMMVSMVLLGFSLFVVLWAQVRLSEALDRLH